MSSFHPPRRQFLQLTSSGVLAAATLSRTTPVRAGAVASGEENPLGALRQVEAGVLSVGVHETGPANGPVVVLLHGYPYAVDSFSGVAPRLAAQGFRVITPHLRGHGPTRFLDPATPRSGEQAAIGQDLVDLMDALGIRSALMAGYDWGGRAACVAAALWPERCTGLVSVNGYLIQDIAQAGRPLPAEVEHGFWYQFYFLTERGRAGLAAHRAEIARVLWRNNSPLWSPSDAEFARSAAAFDNPDYVDVVIHSYRHRLGAAPGFGEYAALQRRLSAQPPIPVPTITLDGEADGVVRATDGTAQAARFTGRRVHRTLAGLGHNPPQEDPVLFAEIILDCAALSAGR